MKTVTEILDPFPVDGNIHKLKRREDLLLQVPPPTAMKLWRTHDPLVAVHFPQQYIPAKFAPPRDIYAGDFLRLEWQQMNARQPFYHRNADVDEISYQVSGERTLMTELGSVGSDRATSQGFRWRLHMIITAGRRFTCSSTSMGQQMSAERS